MRKNAKELFMKFRKDFEKCNLLLRFILCDSVWNFEAKIRTDGRIGHARNRFADVLLGSYEDRANEQQENGDARVQPEDDIVDANGFFLQEAFNRCEEVQHGYRVFFCLSRASKQSTIEKIPGRIAKESARSVPSVRRSFALNSSRNLSRGTGRTRDKLFATVCAQMTLKSIREEMT